jgi:hypothetical protein
MRGAMFPRSEKMVTKAKIKANKFLRVGNYLIGNPTKKTIQVIIADFVPSIKKVV